MKKTASAPKRTKTFEKIGGGLNHAIEIACDDDRKGRGAKANPNRCPTHPGALLREDVLPALKMTKAGIAEAIGISRQHLYDILGERKPVSPEVAVRLGKAFGDGPDIWLRMQAAYDAWHAARKVDVRKVKVLRAA